MLVYLTTDGNRFLAFVAVHTLHELQRTLPMLHLSSQRFQDLQRMELPLYIPPLIDLHAPLKLLKYLIGQKKGVQLFHGRPDHIFPGIIGGIADLPWGVLGVFSIDDHGF